jgi:hypothetical protein
MRLYGWPLIMRMEGIARRSPQLPAGMRTLERLMWPFSIPGISWLTGGMALPRDVFDNLRNKDWSKLRKQSLRDRQTYRRDLERVVKVGTLFGFLETQPAMLRMVHAPPPISGELFSIELWTAIITLAGALASALTVVGTRSLGRLNRVTPYIGATLAPLGLYLLCLLIAERLLFDTPESSGRCRGCSRGGHPRRTTRKRWFS